jgi:hypothetical protein
MMPVGVLEAAVIELWVLGIESPDMEEKTILMKVVVLELPFSGILGQQSKLAVIRKHMPSTGVQVLL